MAKRKEKGQFFIDKNGKVHVGKENGQIVRGMRYPGHKGHNIMRLMFRVSGDGRYLVLMHKEIPWTAGFIRKDRWVNRIIDLDKTIPEKHGSKFSFIK